MSDQSPEASESSAALAEGSRTKRARLEGGPPALYTGMNIEGEINDRPPKPDLSAFAGLNYNFGAVEHSQEETAAVLTSFFGSPEINFPEGVQRIVISYAEHIDLVSLQIRYVPSSVPVRTTPVVSEMTSDNGVMVGVAAMPTLNGLGEAVGSGMFGANAVVIPLNHYSSPHDTKANEQNKLGRDGSATNIIVPRLAFQYAVPREELLFPALSDAMTSLYPLATKYEMQVQIPTPGLVDIMTYVIHQCNARNNFRIPKPLRSKNLHDVMPDAWLACWFSKMKRQQLYDLIVNAGRLNFTDLAEYGCVTVASLIKGQSLDHIKMILDPSGAQNKVEAPVPDPIISTFENAGL